VRWSDVLDFVFPPACTECDAVGEALCASCFPPQSPLHFALQDLQCVALGEYAGPLRRAVLALKSGRRDVAEALGMRLAMLISTTAAGLLTTRCVTAGSELTPFLVPVPTTAARKRERGFDQGELLATTAARRIGATAAPILRQTGVLAQHGRSRVARLAAVGRFSVTEIPRQRAPVLLIDDVATTGATLHDCARALRECGLEPVGAAVVAYARS
jgi:ComF family protein